MKADKKAGRGGGGGVDREIREIDEDYNEEDDEENDEEEDGEDDEENGEEEDDEDAEQNVDEDEEQGGDEHAEDSEEDVEEAVDCGDRQCCQGGPGGPPYQPGFNICTGTGIPCARTPCNNCLRHGYNTELQEIRGDNESPRITATSITAL